MGIGCAESWTCSLRQSKQISDHAAVPNTVKRRGEVAQQTIEASVSQLAARTAQLSCIAATLGTPNQLQGGDEGHQQQSRV